jgi:hypothetical protein
VHTYTFTHFSFISHRHTHFDKCHLLKSTSTQDNLMLETSLILHQLVPGESDQSFSESNNFCIKNVPVPHQVDCNGNIENVKKLETLHTKPIKCGTMDPRNVVTDSLNLFSIWSEGSEHRQQNDLKWKFEPLNSLIIFSILALTATYWLLLNVIIIYDELEH